MTPPSDLLSTAIQHHQAGQLVEAERLYLAVLQAEPNQAKVLYLLGLAAHQSGNFDAAVNWYQRAIAVQPDYADAHNNLGVLMQQLGQLEQATVHYRAALQVDPNNPRVHGNLGAILQQLGELEVAIAHYQTAIRLEPNLAAAHTNLGHALKAQGHYHRAIGHYEEARRLMPTNPEAYRDLGDALQEQGQFREALAVYDRALALAPNHVEVGGSRVRALLMGGNLVEGFAEYDRWRLTVASRPRPFTQPQWDGSSLNGQTILLYAETGSGLGDSLQFIRYAPLVAQYGGRIIVECQPSLVRLFTAIASIDQVITAGDPLPAFDVQASLMSLPHLLGTSLESIPASVPYLPVPIAGTVLPLSQLARPKVGVAWGGNPAHGHDRDRACPFGEFKQILATPMVTFYSLQKGAHREALKTDAAIQAGTLPVVDLGDRLTDFAETAAIVQQLDLVITVDTAIAHLAGALGKPVWILLSFTPDWRWMLARTDSPWYPTARLFRQPQRRDWARVCQQVKRAIAAQWGFSPEPTG